MRSRTLTILGITLLIVGIGISSYMTYMARKDLQTYKASLDTSNASLAELKLQISDLQSTKSSYSPSSYETWLSSRKVSINTRSDGKEEIYNPGGFWSVTFPEKTYNVAVASASDVIIANPNNQGLFVQIRSVAAGQEFANQTGTDPGYAKDTDCAQSTVKLNAGNFIKYSCTLAHDYYNLSTPKTSYSIIVSSDKKVDEETQRLLNSFMIVSSEN